MALEVVRIRRREAEAYRLYVCIDGLLNAKRLRLLTHLHHLPENPLHLVGRQGRDGG
jgi:hypothetical protein